MRARIDFFIFGAIFFCLTLTLTGCSGKVADTATPLPATATPTAPTATLTPAVTPTPLPPTATEIPYTPTPTEKEQEMSTGKQPDNSFKLIGYLPNWCGNDVIYNVNLEKFTHIYYAFAIPTAEGTVRDLADNGFAKLLIEAAHKHNVKVFLSLGGWSYNGVPLESTFANATSTPEKIEMLSTNIVDMALKYGFDGIDLDWEHPRKATAKRYENFVCSLAKHCDDAGLYLTCAIIAGSYMDEGVTDIAISKFDWINVMCYDGGAGADHAPMSMAESYTSYWVNDRGLAKEKVILGVPFYERPNWATYADIVADNPENAHKDSTTYKGGTVYYNGLETMAKKASFAVENCGGVMIWEITQDAKDKDLSLLNAICTVLTEEGVYER